MENEEKEILEQNKQIGMSQKIRNLINDGNFVGILPLLSKENREDFTDVITECFDERNSKLFWRKLEQLCSETLKEAEQRRVFEDIQATIMLEDFKRSKLNDNQRRQVSEHISELKKSNSDGEYLSNVDRHFLEDYDEQSFEVSEQKRLNAFQQEKFETMNYLGQINLVRDNNSLRERTLNSINKLIKEKQEFVSSGGDLNNSNVDYDRQISQLYSVLDDISIVSEVVQSGKKR